MTECWVETCSLCFNKQVVLTYMIVFIIYFRIFSANFLFTLLSPQIATSINIHVPYSIVPLFRLIINPQHVADDPDGKCK